MSKRTICGTCANRYTEAVAVFGSHAIAAKSLGVTRQQIHNRCTMQSPVASEAWLAVEAAIIISTGESALLPMRCSGCRQWRIPEPLAGPRT